MLKPQSESELTEYRAAIEAARQMTPGEKLLAGPRMYDEAIMDLRAKVHAQFPAASEQAVRDIVSRCVNIWRERTGCE